MRNECNIIWDILPLYVEEMVSEDTISFVDEHLEKCADCRAILVSMKNPNELERVVSDTQDNDTMPIKVFAKKWNRKKRIIISSFAAILLITALLGSCLVSYLKFDTANPFSAASGFIQIVLTNKEYVEIQNSPKVILAQANYAVFEEYMESRGFIEVEEEQLGGLRVFSNGNEKEWIMYSQNAYFSKWVWK